MKMVLNSDAHNCSIYSNPFVSLKYFLWTVVKVTFCKDGGGGGWKAKVNISSDRLLYLSRGMCFHENISTDFSNLSLQKYSVQFISRRQVTKVLSWLLTCSLCKSYYCRSSIFLFYLVQLKRLIHQILKKIKRVSLGYNFSSQELATQTSEFNPGLN